MKDQSLNTVVGVMGFLRCILPVLLKFDNQSITNIIIEIIDLCLQFLHENNHSIINASLEVLNVILSNTNFDLKSILRSSSLEHNDILLKRKSLKNQIFHIVVNDSRNVSRKSSTEIPIKDLKIENEQFLRVSANHQNCSDADSLKSMEFDAEITLSHGETKMDSTSLKSQKSTESIGSFFNSILGQTNTDSMTKFFVRSPKSVQQSPIKEVKKPSEDDNLSLDSMNASFVSMDKSLVGIDSSLVTVKEHVEEKFYEEPKIVIERPELLEESLLEMELNNIFIGSIFDQNILHYAVRLICSKFLLTGKKSELISDQIVRVSIKSLSLLVVSNAVAILPEILFITLVIDQEFESNLIETFEIEPFDDEEIEIEEEQAGKLEEISDLLEIKDDHFGESTTNYVDFFTCLSKSTDDSLFLKLDQSLSSDNFKRNSKLNKDLNQILTKSDTSDLKTRTNTLTKFQKVVKVAGVEISEDSQKIHEILLFHNNLDPVLRGNVKNIIGSFLKSVLESSDYLEFLCKFSLSESTKSVFELVKLLEIIVDGFFDEIHTVVNKSLCVFEQIFSYIIEIITEEQVRNLLDNLSYVFDNKYWLVQCKYCDVISSLNYERVNSKLGLNIKNEYQKKFQENLFILTKDNDIRVRNHAGKSICWFIKNLQVLKKNIFLDNKNQLLNDFISERIFMELPVPLNHINDKIEISSDSEKKLANILYRLSNELLEIKDKNQQVNFYVISLEILD